VSEIKFSLIKQFGPSIFKAEIPVEVISKLNQYIDKTVKDKNKTSDLDHGENLVGDVTQEFILEPDFIKSSGWLQFLGTCTKKWIELETNKLMKKFNIESSWVVRQFENEYNPTHWHTGHISGAGFLKVPNSLGSHTQKTKSKSMDYRGGQLQLIHGSKMFLSQSTINIEPKVGEMYFFPNYLMHCVFPFKNSNEERRSISFNATIDEEIYNVYGKS
tara:strand:- start:176 stop:826 length:651 start_codon:yes stop_codon:yes gene_type:complete